MGLMMLAGAVVREQGKGFDDFGWRRGGDSSSIEWKWQTVGDGGGLIAGPRWDGDDDGGDEDSGR